MPDVSSVFGRRWRVETNGGPVVCPICRASLITEDGEVTPCSHLLEFFAEPEGPDWRRRRPGRGGDWTPVALDYETNAMNGVYRMRLAWPIGPLGAEGIEDRITSALDEFEQEVALPEP